jgi:hypothetical protein
MTMHLQHDPTTKQQIKEALYAFLYAPVKLKFQRQLEAIIDANVTLKYLDHPSFTYKGEYYSKTELPGPRPTNRLHPSLYPSMDAYLEDLRRMNAEEVPLVLGYINQVLNASNNLPDYRHLLPESVHGPVYKMLVSCPCNSRALTDEQIAELQQKHAAGIALIKQRQVMNLLI